MPHIFISYSRKDIDGAQKIVDALAENNLDTWVDWKSIPKGEDWEQEIYRGIEEADAFIFLISPDSVMSAICDKEVAHAVNNGKRILPIVLRDTDLQLVHPEISKRNWIIYRDGQGDFNKAIEDTRKAIHTDYEWLKYHTKLQVKALDWKQRQDNSRLLRGKELQEAELELASSGTKDPLPTDLQRQYVLTSRQAASRQLRLITSSSILASAVILLLAIMAFYLLNQSEARRVAASAAAKVAEGDPQLGAILALQSLEMNPEKEGNDALAGAMLKISQVYQYNMMAGHSESVNSVAWSEDGRLASGSNDGTIIIWDIASGQPSRKLEHPKGELIDLWVNSIAWSKDGQLASGSAGGTVIIWDLQSGKPKLTKTLPYHQVECIAWSNDGRLAIGLLDSTIVIWDTNTNELSDPLVGHSSWPNSIAWSNDGQLVSGSQNSTNKGTDLSSGQPEVSQEQQEIIIWDLILGKPKKILRYHTDSVNSVAWSPQGQLASGSDDGTIILWDLHNDRPDKIIQTPYLWIKSIAWSGEEMLASDSGTDNQVVIWDVNDGTPRFVMEGGHSGLVNSVAWAKDGRLASGSDDSTVVVWELRQVEPAQILVGHSEPVNDLAWSSRGQLASGSSDNKIIIWDLDKGQPYRILDQEHIDIGKTLAWSKDGQHLATGGYDRNVSPPQSTVIIWELQDDEYVVKNALPVDQDPGDAIPIVEDLAWSTDGKLAVELESYFSESTKLQHSVQVWDLTKPTPSKISLSYANLYTPTWLANGKLATGSTGGKILIWDIDWKQQNAELSRMLEWNSKLLDFNSSTDVAWIDDGHLAVGFPDGSVLIGDSDSVRPSTVLTGSSKNAYGFAWSPDGQPVYVSRNEAIIWELNTEKPVEVHLPTLKDVMSADWSPNGQLALSMSDGTILILSKALAQSPCAWVGRNLTRTEWEFYVGSLHSYHPACENLPAQPAPQFKWKDFTRLLDNLVPCLIGLLYIVFLILIGIFVWYIRYRRPELKK